MLRVRSVTDWPEDSFERRWSFIYHIAIIRTSSSYEMLVIARMIGGIGVGAALILAPLTLPRSHLPKNGDEWFPFSNLIL